MTRLYGPALDSAARTLLQVMGQQPAVAPLLGPTAVLLSMIAADVDTHVSRRLQQAEHIQGLLKAVRDAMAEADADAGGIDAALGSRLEAPEDFSIASVEAHAAVLRRALVHAQAWLEGEAGRRHPALLAAVWDFLEADVRHVSRLVTPLW